MTDASNNVIVISIIIFVTVIIIINTSSSSLSSPPSSSSLMLMVMCCLLQVTERRLSSPQRYHGNRSNTDCADHRAGKFRPESPLLEDYVVIPHAGYERAVDDDDYLTVGQLALISTHHHSFYCQKE